MNQFLAGPRVINFKNIYSEDTYTYKTPLMFQEDTELDKYLPGVKKPNI